MAILPYSFVSFFLSCFLGWCYSGYYCFCQHIGAHIRDANPQWCIALAIIIPSVLRIVQRIFRAKLLHLFMRHVCMYYSSHPVGFLVQLSHIACLLPHCWFHSTPGVSWCAHWLGGFAPQSVAFLLCSNCLGAATKNMGIVFPDLYRAMPLTSPASAMSTSLPPGGFQSFLQWDCYPLGSPSWLVYSMPHRVTLIRPPLIVQCGWK